MKRLRFYQLSLRRLLCLTSAAAAGVWLALVCIGQFTPPRGETLVPPAERQVLQALAAHFGLSFGERSPFM